MKVFVDESGCIGCGICEGICPSVFEVKDGVSKVICEDPLPFLDEVKEATGGCPTSVISYEE